MTTSRYERIIIWIILADLIAIFIFCIFWTPFNSLKLLHPIPANAVLVSSHYDLGPRLENMATNIFLKSFFDSNESALKNLRNNRYAARILASRSILAYVPDLNQLTARGARSSSPALVISAWVGGWAPVLRWVLWIHPPGDIAPLEDYNGHRLWAYKKPVSFFGAVNYFSFVIDEGIFIGCLSQERNGVVYLLGNYDGGKDSILNVPQSRLIASSSAADQVWLRIDLPHATQNKPFFAVCSIDALENDYLSATIRFDPDPGFANTNIWANDSLRQNKGLAEIGKMYACLPSGIALFPSDLVAKGLNGFISPDWVRTVKPILAPPSGTNNVCLLMVFTGNYGGKLGKEPFRITVPTVLLAVSGSRPEQTKAAVLELLDFINLKHRLGLILNSALPPVGPCPVFAIQSTSNGLLQSLPVEDQPAFAFFNDWFLLASNSAGLRKLLASFQSQSVPVEMGRNSNTVAGGADAGPASARPATDVSYVKPNLLKQAGILQKNAFIWIDPDAGGKALRLAFMTSIIMLNTDNTSNQNAIKILKAARSWLEGISNLKNCAAWLETENGKTVVRLEIGRKLKPGFCTQGAQNPPAGP